MIANCYYCGHRFLEDETVCPECGRDRDGVPDQLDLQSMHHEEAVTHILRLYEGYFEQAGVGPERRLKLTFISGHTRSGYMKSLPTNMDNFFIENGHGLFRINPATVVRIEHSTRKASMGKPLYVKDMEPS